MNKNDADTHKYWLRTILTEAELSEWEAKFIADMKIRLDNGWALTDSQEAKLEQIYVSKTS